MPTPTKGPRLGAGPSHERSMLANLATSLFEHGRITTTETKARRGQPMAERLVARAERGQEKTVTSEAEKARGTKFAKDQQSESTAAETADGGAAETVTVDATTATESDDSDRSQEDNS